MVKFLAKVPDTPENLEICKKNCGPCATFKPNQLNEYDPHALFCARGASAKPKDQINDYGCNCPGCLLWETYDLEGGWFCIHVSEGKK